MRELAPAFRKRRQAAALQTEIGLTLVAAEVQHLEGAERFPIGLQLTLDLDQSFSSRVNPELAEVCGDPFTPELLGHSRSRAATAEEVRHQIAFVAAGFDNPFN